MVIPTFGMGGRGKNMVLNSRPQTTSANFYPINNINKVERLQMRRVPGSPCDADVNTGIKEAELELVAQAVFPATPDTVAGGSPGS